jgi:hypothetical protein
VSEPDLTAVLDVRFSSLTRYKFIMKEVDLSAAGDGFIGAKQELPTGNPVSEGGGCDQGVRQSVIKV